MTTPSAPTPPPEDETGRFPARLHVLLASQAPVGLVIRRGPSHRVATVGWDRRRDRFEVGQWMKGRIYERRCDLSPDGQHLLYFAMNGHWQSETRGAWSAISRAPYLKAIALFPKGDCWHGGGLWTGKTTYWLNDGYGHSVLRDTKAVRRDPSPPSGESFGGECPGVYYRRLLRDGWSLRSVGKDRVSATVDVFEKPLSHAWLLRKLAHAEVGAPPGKGCYWDEHELIAPDGAVLSLPSWEWAEVDGGRLVWASEGKLHAARLEARGLTKEELLFDFDTLSYAELRAPY